MDDEPMWAADRVVALTPGSTITILETANEFAIKALFDRLLGEIRSFSQHENESLTDAWLRMKEMLRNCHSHNMSKGNIIKIFYHGLSEITQEVPNATAGGIFLYKTPNQAYQLLEDKVLLKLDWAKNQKTKSSLKKTVAFADEGSSNSNTDKIMARIDAMTLKMDAQYKVLQTHAKKTKPDLSEDDIPMSREEEAKFMQTFCKTRFYNDYRDRDSNRNNWRSNERSSYNRDNYRSNTDDKPYDLQKQFNDFMKSQQSTNAFFKETFMDLKTQLETELISNKHKIEQISAAFLSDKNPTMIQNKVPPKLGDPRSFLIPCSFNKIFSCNALADLGASINLMPYSLYAKLSLESLKPTKMSIRLADKSFQYPIGIAENMLVEVGKFSFPVNFVILEMEEDIKVPLILRRPFLHTDDAVIRVKQKQLNLYMVIDLPFREV
uniref:Reverse transcriptase domain-containing protein n=1 Tax=Tanacetum cinerariifolium TaxID=118510 RepID=A0A6L2MGB0_TANCI|nr:reverse transcriptase domain-containing protein [Tanacetum cinerariifolium]